MIKLIGVPSRKAGWSEQEFYQHYFERHGPLAASVKEYGKYARKYTQNYATMRDMDPPIPGHALARDGLSEIWFDDVDGLSAAYREPQYTRVLRTDELRFVSLDSIIVAVCQERPLFDAPRQVDPDKAWAHECRHRLFCFRAPASPGNVSEFQRAWLGAAPQVMSSQPFKRFVRRYGQSHVKPVEAGLPGDCEFGVIDEYWFDRDADALQFWHAYRATPKLVELDEQLTNPGRLQIMFARAHVVYGA